PARPTKSSRLPSLPRESGARLRAAALPAHALRRVLEHDAFGRERGADGIGTGEIARLLCRRALVDQGLDARVVVAGCAAAEPVGGYLLQQAERPSGAEQRRLQPCPFVVAAGLARARGDRGPLRQRLRRVEVV